MTKTDLYEFLAGCKLGVLGTIGTDDRPQSSLIGIATSGELEIIFDTLKTTRKYRTLSRDLLVLSRSDGPGSRLCSMRAMQRNLRRAN